MRKDKLHSPVFVTGVERSGSSIIARIISMCGGFTGEITEMYENKQIKSMVTDYYKSLSLPPEGQYPLPDTEKMLIPVNWRIQIEEIIHKEGYDDSKLWMYKGGRSGQIWPIWHYAFPNAKWIIVRRRTGDIIQSCLKTGFMTAFADEGNQMKVEVTSEKDGWLWWVHEHEKLFVDMIETGLNCKVVWPERMVHGDYQQIYEMLEWLGLEWNDEIVNKIHPLLWNGRKERSK